MRRRIAYILITSTALLTATIATSRGRNLLWATYTRIRGRHTIDERLDQYGGVARERMQPYFDQAGIEYPPAVVTLLAIKEQQVLQVYAGTERRSWRFVREYPIKGLSGDLGPKLREGDRQVPEGHYAIESLNPNSRFHLALRLDYPNSYDTQRGKDDGRASLGSDIMIHGGSASIGCLAMGDPVAEELFVLIADVGRERASVIISPVDFRVQPHWRGPTSLPTWAPVLYVNLKNQIANLPNRQVANRSTGPAVARGLRK